jgi:preprotein translocase subunit SecB
MQIQLRDWKVKELSLSSKQKCTSEGTDDNKFQLSFGHAFNQDNAKEFVIGFKIGIDRELFHIDLEMVFIFDTDTEMTPEFKDSTFLRINAPAIAFPYIRSYISNITLQSGYEPIILPSINFVSLSKDNRCGK